MTAAASTVLAALEAHPGSRVWELADLAGLPAAEVYVALRQLEGLGRAVRGQDEHAIVVWSAVEPRSAA